MRRKRDAESRCGIEECAEGDCGRRLTTDPRSEKLEVRFSAFSGLGAAKIVGLRDISGLIQCVHDMVIHGDTLCKQYKTIYYEKTIMIYIYTHIHLYLSISLSLYLDI